MAVADTPHPSGLLPYRVKKAEEAIHDLQESKASHSDVALIRQDIKDLRLGIRNWAIAGFGGFCVVVAGVVAVVHPHVLG